MSALRPTTESSFVPRPDGIGRILHWPTDNHFLFSEPDRFFARTRVNPDYGRPGWTRDCGKRFHRGCDIAPVHVTPDGNTHTVMFSNCEDGTEYPAHEPGWIPHDTIYAVADGKVVERNHQAKISTLGRYVIVQHAIAGCVFFSLYAHLESMAVEADTLVHAGEIIATMGRTSSSADACTWMAVAPHLHLEFWDEQGRSFDPEAMLRALLR